MSNKQNVREQRIPIRFLFIRITEGAKWHCLMASERETKPMTKYICLVSDNSSKSQKRKHLVSKMPSSSLVVRKRSRDIYAHRLIYYLQVSIFGKELISFCGLVYSLVKSVFLLDPDIKLWFNWKGLKRLHTHTYTHTHTHVCVSVRIV